MKLWLSILMIMMSASLLSACTTNSSFDCPNKAGVNCRSLDQINAMVDSGEIHGRMQGSGNDSSLSMMNQLKERDEFQSFPNSSTFIPGQPIRYGETVQRIWIAPYEDMEGNYHQDSVLYAVMKGGHWIARPVKTIRSF